MLTPAMMSLIAFLKGQGKGGCTRHDTHKASEDNCAPSQHAARGGGGSYLDTGYDDDDDGDDDDEDSEEEDIRRKIRKIIIL